MFVCIAPLKMPMWIKMWIAINRYTSLGSISHIIKQKYLGGHTIAAWGLVKSVHNFTCKKKSQNVNLQFPFQVLAHLTSVSKPTRLK